MNPLRTWRKARDLTQDQMAEMLCISVGSLSRIERGEQWPDRAFFERLTEVTGGSVTANDLVAVSTNQPKPDLNLTGEAA